MNRTKGYALMFLLGAFIAGGALGFSADRAMRGDHGREMRGPRAYRQRLHQFLDRIETFCRSQEIGYRR